MSVDPAEVRAALKALRATLDDELLDRFQRSLPFGDALFDRWERARRLGFGEGASVYDSALVFGETSVGDNTWIGPYVILDGSGGGLSIGSYCSVSAGVHIYTHDTVRWALSGGTEPARRGSVAVGDRCYLGSQSVITPGVTIGDQVVVAANSLVRRDVPPRTIVGGSPATTLGEVREEDGRIVLDYGAR